MPIPSVYLYSQTGEGGTPMHDVIDGKQRLEAILPQLKATRFSQLADSYTLVLLLHRLRDEGLAVNGHSSTRNKLAGALLTDFGRGVDEVSDKVRRGEGATAAEEPFRQYLMTVRAGTDSRPQREAREKLLRTVLEGVFETRDSTRTFNTTQRRILGSWCSARHAA